MLRFFKSLLRGKKIKDPVIEAPYKVEPPAPAADSVSEPALVAEEPKAEKKPAAKKTTKAPTKPKAEKKPAAIKAPKKPKAKKAEK